MFEKCRKCVGGLTCRNDYASLNSGYWWEWRNKTQKDRYRHFLTNLLAFSPALDASSVKYLFPIPTPYRCPREESWRVVWIPCVKMVTKVHSVTRAAQDTISAVTNVCTMSFKEMDGRTVVDHCSYCYYNHCSFIVDEQEKEKERGKISHSRHAIFQA